MILELTIDKNLTQEKCMNKEAIQKEALRVGVGFAVIVGTYFAFKFGEVYMSLVYPSVLFGIKMSLLSGASYLVGKGLVK